MVNIDMTGLLDFRKKLEALRQDGPNRLRKEAEYQAMVLTEQAKELVRVDFSEGGATEQGLTEYVSFSEDSKIQFGIYTNNELTIYHEFGTGPVGTEAGYPGEAELDTPIVRVTEGWTYYVEEPVMVQKSRENPELGMVESNFIYTEGQPPSAFMSTSVTLLKDQCTAELLAAFMGDKI